MGLFCVNFHLRATDERSVADAMSRRGITRFHVVPAKTGWTALYEERASEQDDQWILQLGRGLSEELQVAVIAFLVHDSDIACYWLFDNGQLLDEYNSDPSYFDSDTDGPPSPSGGRTEILVRYCRPGIRQAELAAILAEEAVQEATFAEEIIDRLARVLGIDPTLATSDCRDLAGGTRPRGRNGTEDDDEEDGGRSFSCAPASMGRPDDNDEEPIDGPSLLPTQATLIERLTRQLAFDAGSVRADPQVTALVQAAVCGDTDTIDRLLTEGVPVNAQGLAPLCAGSPVPGLAQLFPGGIPQIAMTPLLAAVVHKQRRAAERLLRAGADPNLGHPRLGAPLHGATGGGDVELVQLLIEHGADVNARDTQGQTPLQRLAARRPVMEKLLQMQAMVKARGVKLPPQIAKVSLLVAGWKACAELLTAHGAH
jgi:hypothetical protein